MKEILITKKTLIALILTAVALFPLKSFSQDRSEIESLRLQADSLIKKYNSAVETANDSTPKLQIEQNACEDCESDVKLSALVLSFGLLTIIGLLSAMLIRKKFFGPNFTKIIGVTVILTFALLLPTLNVQGELVTALVGLIGTLGGYLFGKSDDYDSKDDKETQAERTAREARERGDFNNSAIG